MQVRLVVMACRHEMLKGHTHLAVAIVQAMLEYHCFAPPPLGAPQLPCNVTSRIEAHACLAPSYYVDGSAAVLAPKQAQQRFNT